jgi:hypothetical protein
LKHPTHVGDLAGVEVAQVKVGMAAITEHLVHVFYFTCVEVAEVNAL